MLEQEFKLHLFGQAIAHPMPLAAAFLAGLGEVILPVLLVLGLGTRFAALGVLLMTIVIQLTVPDGLINFHLPRVAMALALMAFGVDGFRWTQCLRGCCYNTTMAAPQHCKNSHELIIG